MQTNVKNSGFMDGKNPTNGKGSALEASAKPSRVALEFQDFLADIEDLIAEATTMTGDELAKAKSKLNDRIDTIKHSFDDIGGGISQKARRGAAITNHYVHEQPWTVIGATALAGAVFGYLLSRRS